MNITLSNKINKGNTTSRFGEQGPERKLDAK
jgi:hypothetical protein